MIVITEITATITFIASASMTRPISAMSYSTKRDRSSASPFSVYQHTDPTIVILIRPFRNSKTELNEKRRLKPLAGEILLNFGISDSADTRKPFCSNWDAIAAIISTASSGSSAFIGSISARAITCCNPPPSTENSCGRSMKGRIVAVRWLHMKEPRNEKPSVAPMNIIQ